MLEVGRAKAGARNCSPRQEISTDSSHQFASRQLLILNSRKGSVGVDRIKEAIRHSDYVVGAIEPAQVHLI